MKLTVPLLISLLITTSIFSQEEETPKTPGSFMMDLSKDLVKPSKLFQKDKNQSWKKDRKKDRKTIRKHKESSWS